MLVSGTQMVISLEIRDVHKYYGPRVVLDGINFSASSGCTVIIGPNGSGKSTLLRIIAGLVSPSDGNVVFSEGGVELPSAARRDIIGLVAPEVALYNDLSALENLQFFARVRGLSLPEIELTGLLAYLGLEGREHDRLGSYSSGMRQRAKYAVALLHKPPVLLLDEPSTNLDDSGIAVAERVIEHQRQTGLVIIATNQATEVELGDQIIRLESWQHEI